MAGEACTCVLHYNVYNTTQYVLFHIKTVPCCINKHMYTNTCCTYSVVALSYHVRYVYVGYHTKAIVLYIVYKFGYFLCFGALQWTYNVHTERCLRDVVHGVGQEVIQRKSYKACVLAQLCLLRWFVNYSTRIVSHTRCCILQFTLRSHTFS
jgi:hypothetical protein